MAYGPKSEMNRTVELYPEAEQSRRVVFEIAPTHVVRWIQCHRCRRRFWYAVLDETPQEEGWEWGKRLRARLLGEPCSEHVGVRPDGATDAAARRSDDGPAGDGPRGDG